MKKNYHEKQNVQVSTLCCREDVSHGKSCNRVHVKNRLLISNALLFFVFIFLYGESRSQCLIFSETFDNSLGQFTATVGNNADWVWANNCNQSSSSGHSAPGSAMFQGAGCNFGNPGFTVSGEMISPSISIQNPGQTLTFNYYLWNECGNSGSACFYDVLYFDISTNGGVSYTNIAHSESTAGGLITGGWHSYTHNLNSYVGQNIILRYRFNSKDAAVNDYDGVYIDDVIISEPCPYDISPTSIVLPDPNAACYSADDTLRVRVTNVGSNNLTFSFDPFLVNYEVTGPYNVVQTGSKIVNSGSALATGGFVEVDLTTSLDLYETGNYSFKVWTSSTWDSIYHNDTLKGYNLFVPGIYSSASPQVLTSPYATSKLKVTSPFFPPNQILFSEIMHEKGANGAPSGGWAAYPWVIDTDNLELIGPPNASLEGYKIELWYEWMNTPDRTYTFPANAELNANGAAYLGWGGPSGGSVDWVNNYYRAGISSNWYSAWDDLGYIIKDPDGNIVDVVVHGGWYTWNAAAGVTSSDWTGVTTYPWGASGIRRVGATDTNSNTDWVAASSTNIQDPNVFNPTVNPINAVLISGIEWSYEGNFIDTTLNIEVGPFTESGTYPYIVTYNSPCRLYSDTLDLIVNLTNTETTINKISCFGETDASLTAVSTGGDAPYSYSWNTGDTTSSISGLGAGTYIITITDDNGWPATDTIVIIEPDPLDASFDASPVYCVTSPGSLTVNPIGGTTPYSYLWSNNQATATASNLTYGVYSVTITDAHNCTATFTDTIPLDLFVSNVSSVTQVSCKGDSDGEASVMVSGGLPPYDISWSNNQNGTNATGLEAGLYTVLISDSSGCINIETVMVTEPEELVANVWEEKNPTCYGFNDGAITVVASGGTPPFIYEMLSPQTNGIFKGLSADTYTVNISDKNNCEASKEITLTEPDEIDNTVEHPSPLTLEAKVSGAEYQWVNCSGNVMLPGENNQNFTASANGSYKVIISQDGCSVESECAVINSVGIHTYSADNSLRVFPNPSNGNFTIVSEKEGDFTLINGIGQTVQKINISAENNFKAEIRGVSTGVYYLIGIEDNKPVQKKIMVTR